MIAKAPYNNPDIFLKLADLRISDHKNHINIDKMDLYEKIKASVEEIIKEDECFSLKKLNINGHDLQLLWYFGKEIGLKLKEILELVAAERLENDHDLLIEYSKKAWWIIKPFYYFLSKKLNIKHSFSKNDKYNLLYL